MIKGAFHHGIRCRIAVLIQQMALQGAGIYPNPDRDALLLAGLDDGLHLFAFADIAGIDADLVHPVFNS
ncbi:hypothetical protein D3C71_1866740 [compost metagenome]